MSAVTWMFEPRNAGLTAAAVALALLGGAHGMERLFDLQPCALCLRQREVLWITAACAALAWPAKRASRPVLSATAVLFAASAALAFSHAGAEYGWWLGPAACGATPSVLPTNVLDALQNVTPGPACDEAPFRLMTISPAGANAIISAFLAAFCVAAAIRDEG